MYTAASGSTKRCLEAGEDPPRPPAKLEWFYSCLGERWQEEPTLSADGPGQGEEAAKRRSIILDAPGSDSVQQQPDPLETGRCDRLTLGCVVV